MRALLALFAIIAFAASAQAQDKSLWPAVPKASGEPHPVDEHWRANHMAYMLHDRNLTLREGDRDIKASIGQCFDCHAVKDEAGEFVTYEDDRHFCRVCHDYAAVQVDCFMCHRSTPDPDAALNAEMAKPDEPNSIAAYLARLNAESGQ